MWVSMCLPFGILNFFGTKNLVLSSNWWTLWAAYIFSQNRILYISFYQEIHYCTAVIFRQGAPEPQGSASGCQTNETLNHSSMRLYQYRPLDHCIGFHEQHRHFPEVPRKQSGWQTLLYSHGRWKDFLQEGAMVDFFKCTQKDFSQGSYIVKISLYPHHPHVKQKESLFAKNIIGNS